jgi:hypothetical protein
MQAGGAKASGAIKGKVKRNPAAAGKIGQAKTATKRPARIKGAKINSLDAPNKASSVPKGTIGKTGKIRTAQAFDRNLAAAKLNAPAGRKNAVSVEQRYKTTTSDFASLGGSASGRLTRKQLDKRQRQGQKILNPTSSITDVSPTYSGMSSSMKQRVKEARATRFEGYKSAISAKRTAKPAAAKPAKAARKPKTEMQTLQQADRLMGKLSKRLASINVNKVGLSEGLRQVRRNNARAGRVNSALNSRGLLGKYNKLTAPADAIRMTPAGPGIKQPKAATAGKVGQQAKPQPRRPDQAEVNIKGRFTGQAGKRFDASIDRAVKQVKASERARLMKPKEQVKAERAARAEAKRQAAAAKPKRTRTAESLRASRAKQIEKRRSITTNPAGERASAAAKMAANAARTQQRATAFLKAGGKGTAKAAAKPAKATASKVDLSGAAFTARTRRAQSKLNAAQKDFSARGRSGSDTRSRKRVETLQSAVASLRTINSRAKRQGLPSSDIFKARAKRSTNPKLSPAEKAARTRQNKAAAKFQANVAAMERARRNR